MTFELTVQPVVGDTIADLGARDPKKYRKAVRCLAKLAQDPHHPSLNSHRYERIAGPLGEPIWESYVENHTPAAWRVWWYFGPEQGVITVVSLGPHP